MATKRRFERGRCMVLLMVFCMALAMDVLPVRAQLTSASVNGTVRDASEAALPGAKVVLRSTTTNASRTATTNSSGSYAFVDIDPGSYMIEVSMTGFSTVRQSAVTLAVNQTATFNFRMNVGAVTEQVTVSADQAQLETTVSNLGTVFNPQAVNELPLNGRNFTQLLTLTPGASPVNTSQNSGSGTQSIFVGSLNFPSVNGQWNRSNLYLMDGTNDQMAFYSQYAVPPIVDAIQEFKMQSHNDQAQFGGVMGGIVNVATKYGTNAFHGTVWDFIRNDGLDASNPLLAKKSELRQYVYGATIGGPVRLPLYNGKDRTFFFGAYEGTNRTAGTATFYNVPTPAELNGDFSAVSNKLYDPFTTAPDPAHPGQYLRTAFANNNIASRLDPNMVKLAKDLFPTPIATTNAGTNGVDTTPNVINQNNYSLRLDHHFNQSNQIWGRLSQIHGTQKGSGGYVTLSQGQTSDAQNWAANYVHIFGASATLQLQTGHVWQRYKSVTDLVNVPDSIYSDSGFNQNFLCNYIGTLPCQIPNIGISGYLSGGQAFTDNTGSDIYEYKGNYTKLWGHHTIDAGASFSYYFNRVQQANSTLTLTASQTSNLETSSGGDAMASFLIGVPSATVRRNLIKNLQGGWSNGFYFEDQWRVTPKLTVNWGLRYDFVILQTLGDSPTLSNYTGAYDLRTGKYLLSKTAGKTPACTSTSVAPCIPGGSLPANVVVASSDKLINDQHDNIQPRIGLAYQAGFGTVIHVSYARVFDTWSSLSQAVQNEGSLWPSVGQLQSGNVNTTTVTVTSENPLNQASQQPKANPFSQVAFFVAPYIKNPYSDQWLVGFQKQLDSTTILTMNYVGSKTLRLPCCDYFNTAVTPGPGTVASRSPYSYIAPTHYQQSNGASNYNALQVQLMRQQSNSLAYTLNYTWSKTIDVACDGAFGAEGCFVRNPYNPALDRSVAGFDVPQMFTGIVQYRLPFGKGQRFTANNRPVDAIVGGWQMNAVGTLLSGTPFTVTSTATSIANTGNNYQGVDLVGDPNQISHRSASQWFNTTAFAPAASFTFGNAPRNLLRSQGYANMDFSLFRDFAIKDMKIQLRGEAFNVLNHPVLGVPQAVQNTTITFGKVQSMRSTERQLQLAAKFYF
ncbi:MAG: TonB-dependent receptor [Acidobacteria bacterium]|nr:TonB-dependent receptor [Acidobacteriota bacterium]